MPVVLTDHTNKVWAVEQPNDGFIHVGFTGQSGPKLVDVLEFLATKQGQFVKFVEKKKAVEAGNAKRRIKTDL